MESDTITNYFLKLVGGIMFMWAIARSFASIEDHGQYVFKPFVSLSILDGVASFSYQPIFFIVIIVGAVGLSLLFTDFRKKTKNL